MEAWKTGDPRLQQHPAAALSAATLRWGLAPFPHNLVASHNIDGWPNSTAYPCGDDLAQLCFERPPTCQNLTCLIVIENSGRNYTGPLESNIVVLAHSIVLVLIILTTAAVAMCLDLKTLFREPPRPPSRVLTPPQVQHPPPQPRGNDLERAVARVYLAPWADRYVELRPSFATRAEEVAHVSALLREMFALDLNIWALKRSRQEKDLRKVQDMKQESNAIFTEVRRVVKDWAENEQPGSWTDEEKTQVDEIRQVVYGFPAERHT
ncbi:hypothetical protein B0H63DRAFT_468381 [Podospora didyma]|uniref:Uncharacterized protein n=1 Tax=Podospora didyma TaxID=330526 RepID=A0AAE0NSB2_9PEZI|nr:hypothetical protein B0H63DRAFT_468381 [Podospora didyma]